MSERRAAGFYYVLVGLILMGWVLYNHLGASQSKSFWSSWEVFGFGILVAAVGVYRIVKTGREDESTGSAASRPGGFVLSDKKLRRLRPDLFGTEGIFAAIVMILIQGKPPKAILVKHLALGDSNPAIVMSTRPLLIAAYAQDLDCVAMLRFPDEFIGEYQLVEGKRMLSVNTYDIPEAQPADLTMGPNRGGMWTDFYPLIADFLTEDLTQVEARKAQIPEEAWQRAYLLGKEYLLLRPGVARDGRPIYAAVPAGTAQ